MRSCHATAAATLSTETLSCSSFENDAIFHFDISTAGQACRKICLIVRPFSGFSDRQRREEYAATSFSGRRSLPGFYAPADRRPPAWTPVVLLISSKPMQLRCTGGWLKLRLNSRVFSPLCAKSIQSDCCHDRDSDSLVFRQALYRTIISDLQTDPIKHCSCKRKINF